MKVKSILSGCVILAATTGLFYSEWKSLTKPSSVQIESWRQSYYSESVISLPEQVQESTLHINENAPPTYTVGEREVCGIQVSDLKIYEEKKKEVKEEKKTTNRWNITLTDTEIDLLAKIVWTEARGESDKGERAVVEVVFNRMIYPKEFSGTLYEVLSKKNQFQSWGLRNQAEPTDREYENIETVLNGESDILDFDTVYFSTSPRNDDITAHIGNHYFCKYEFK